MSKSQQQMGHSSLPCLPSSAIRIHSSPHSCCFCTSAMLKTHLLTFLTLLGHLAATVAAEKDPHGLTALQGRRLAARHRNKARLAQRMSERVRLAQVDFHHPRPKSKAKRGPSATPTTTSTSATATATVYSGRQPAPGTCSNTDTSDGCVDPYYTANENGMTLAAGRTFAASGHVNFQYIALSDYRGEGSKRNVPSYWNILSGGTQFDPNNNQPGTKYIGTNYYPWTQGANLPTSGWCIIWVVSHPDHLKTLAKLSSKRSNGMQRTLTTEKGLEKGPCATLERLESVQSRSQPL